MEQITFAFFKDNRNRLIPILEKQALVLIFSNDKMPRTGDQCFPFRQNSNLFYLTGINQPQTILALCPEHPNENMREILFGRAMFAHALKEELLQEVNNDR